MKKTKNTLITGVALAITLFASVQVSAMRVNPHLHDQNKAATLSEIRYYEESLDPKRPISPEDREIAAAHIKGLKEIYYGNKDYTQAEVNQIIDRYVNVVKEKHNFNREVMRRTGNEMRSNPGRAYSDAEIQALLNRYTRELLNDPRYANYIREMNRQ